MFAHVCVYPLFYPWLCACVLVRWLSPTQHLSVSQNWMQGKAVLVTTTAIVNQEQLVTPEMYAVSIAHIIQKITASLGLLLYLSDLLLFCFSYIPLCIPLSVFLFVAFSFHNRSLSWLLFFRVRGRGGGSVLTSSSWFYIGLVWFNICSQLFSYLFYPPFSKDRT